MPGGASSWIRGCDIDAVALDAGLVDENVAEIDADAEHHGAIGRRAKFATAISFCISARSRPNRPHSRTAGKRITLHFENFTVMGRANPRSWRISPCGEMCTDLVRAIRQAVSSPHRRKPQPEAPPYFGLFSRGSHGSQSTRFSQKNKTAWHYSNSCF